MMFRMYLRWAEATVISISDENGIIGYIHIPAMLLEGESAFQPKLSKLK
jgi:C-terminal processing protease CtpA/Prc